MSKQHKLKRQIFSVEILASPEAESSDTLVEVSGFSKEVSREYLEIYFESRKSGGADGALEECVMVRDGIAHLRFNDPEGNNLWIWISSPWCDSLVPRLSGFHPPSPTPPPPPRSHLERLGTRLHTVI